MSQGSVAAIDENKTNMSLRHPASFSRSRSPDGHISHRDPSQNTFKRRALHEKVMLESELLHGHQEALEMNDLQRANAHAMEQPATEIDAWDAYSRVALFLNPLWNALDFLSSGMEEDPRKGSERVWETCTCSHFKTDGADKGELDKWSSPERPEYEKKILELRRNKKKTYTEVHPMYDIKAAPRSAEGEDLAGAQAAAKHIPEEGEC